MVSNLSTITLTISLLSSPLNLNIIEILSSHLKLHLLFKTIGFTHLSLRLLRLTFLQRGNQLFVFSGIEFISNLFQFPAPQDQFEVVLPPHLRQSGIQIGLQSRTDLKY